jgi:hypothetical protein
MKLFVAIILGILPFAVQAKAECPKDWKGVTFTWEAECEIIQDITTGDKVARVTPRTKDGNPSASDRSVAIATVCLTAGGKVDYRILPKDPRAIWFDIESDRNGPRVCIEPCQEVRESANPAAKLEIPPGAKQCSQLSKK